MDFYRKFTKYCECIEHYRTNTFGKHIKNIKAVLNSAIVHGYNVCQEFKHSDFRSPTEQTTAIYLTENEIQSMINLDLSKTPGFERTRDLFVIGCYTGLRYGDFSHLNKAETISGDVLKIKVKTKKTSKEVIIPILKPIRPTFMKFFDAQKGKYTFPKPISNQKFNEQLKDISQKISDLHEDFAYISRINGKEVVECYKKWEMVCTHTARRSFATNMFLRGIKPFLIMKITGHKTEKEFFKYIKIEPEDNANEFLSEFEQSNSRNRDNAARNSTFIQQNQSFTPPVPDKVTSEIQ
jgi:site-specific recombinase XerD